MASNPPPGWPVRPSRGVVRRAIRCRGPEIATRALLLSSIILGWAYVAALSRYEATILFRIDPPGSGPAVALSATEMATLAHLAGSKAVLDVAAADPAIADLPGFRRAVQVNAVPGMPLLAVTARGTPDQAPRVASAVAASIDRAREASEASRRAAREQRLRALRDGSERAEHTWKQYVELAATLGPGEEAPPLDIAALAAARLAADLDAETGLPGSSSAEANPIALDRLRPAGAPGVTLRPGAMAWFWAATFPVIALSSAAMLGLAVACESRRSRPEAGRGLRDGGVGDAPHRGTMLVAIQLVHGDWRPRPDDTP